MKIQRYPYARRSVQELESAKSSLMSPAQAAQTQAAKYAVGTEIAEGIGKVALVTKKRDMQLRAQEDSITEKMALEEFKIGLTALENDPAYQDQVQPDGTPTASLMLEKYEELADNARQSLGAIQDDKSRENALKLFDLSREGGRLAMRNAVNERREVWNAQGLFDLRSIQFEAKDWNAYNQTNREMRESGIITAEQYSAAERLGVKGRQVGLVEDEMGQYKPLIASGNGEAALEKALANPHDDPVVQAGIESEIKQGMANQNIIENKKAALMKTQKLTEKTDLLMAIKQGQPLPMSIDEWTLSGMGVSDAMDVQMLQWREQLYAAQLGNIVEDSGYNEYMANRTARIELLGTKTNKDFLDREIQESMTEGMTPEQVTRRAVDIQLDAGFLSTNTETIFKTSLRSASAMSAAIPLWTDLMMNPEVTRLPSHSIDETTAAILTDVAMQVERGGVDLATATELAYKDYQNKANDPQRQSSIQDFYSSKEESTDEFSRGRTAALESFDDLIEGHYDSAQWLPWGQAAFDDSPQGQLQKQIAFDSYEQMFRNAYAVSENFEVASRSAQIKFRNEYALNNTNGDWQLEQFGAPGNINKVRKDWIKDNGEELVVFQEDGTAREGALSKASDVTFRRPRQTNDGVVYEVWSGNAPMMQNVEMNVGGRKTVRREVVQYTVKADTLPEEQKKANREETLKRIKDLEAEYKTAEKMVKARNPYRLEESQEALRDIPRQIAFERSKLEE